MAFYAAFALHGLAQPAAARARVEYFTVPASESAAPLGNQAKARPARLSAKPATPLQCVPYARAVSGVRLFGDAHTWWGQAANNYARGFVPKVGAIMALRPHGHMVLGHVAMVSRIIDARTILLRHANWSPINGRTGQIEDNVRAVDVSPANDWSEVRVWFAPIKGLGTTHWPVEGFIYNRPANHPLHGLGSSRASNDPIGAIIAAFASQR